MKHARHASVLALATLFACAGGETDHAPPPGDQAPPPAATGTTPPPATTVPPPPACTGDSCNPPPATPSGLKVKFLGVQGFLIEYGGEALLTSPLFTRPNGLQVTTGLPVTSDPSLVSKNIPSVTLANVRAVLSGHAHYDHLLDTPAVLQKAPNATLFSNVSTRNILAAWAPDRAAKCNGTPAQADPIPRSRVIALDDPAKSAIDWHPCTEKKPAGAALDGSWVAVPGANMRVLAVCSEHPDQIGPMHYGEGDVTDEQCTPPKNMNEWKEGLTLGFLVDFLDPTTKKPVYRIYYEDAPAGTVKGQVPASFLAERRIDLALACVGSYQNVPNAPQNTLATMNPRFALGGHWDDFLQGADTKPTPVIPLLDVATWDSHASTAMPAGSEPKPMKRNGTVGSERVLRPEPGDTFEIP